MMKKQFFVVMMVFLGLFAGAGTMRGQISLGDVDLDDPTSWFYVTLNAGVSTPACGSNPGEVKLNYTNTRREQDNPWITGTKPVNPYNPETEYTLFDDWKGGEGFERGVSEAKNGTLRENITFPSYLEEWGEDRFNALKAGCYAGYDWYVAGHYLNTASPTAWGASAALNGYALFHMEGVDSVLNGMFSSYAYFEAKVRENDGWYFAGWSFTEGETDLGGAVDTDTEEDKGKLFKIFPSDNPGWENKSQEYVYATFKPVMVADYTVNGTIDVNPLGSKSSTVTFEVQGDRVSVDDFTATVASAETGGYTGHGTCTVSPALENGKIVVTVTFTSTENATGVYRANVTLASKSGCSELTAPVFVRVAATSSAQASLYNNKVAPENLVESGDLTTLIGKAAADQIVALNDEYTSALSIDRDVTIDLNGYTLSNTLTVAEGNVVLAYNKYGGNITNTVTVQNGATLTLNGGTIAVEGTGNPLDPSGAVVAVNVQEGGTLIQNGATIRATATTCYAIGINVDGTATITEGVMNAHADYTAAFAVQVGAAGKLTTTGGTFNASVNQAHNPTPDPNDQTTWSNAYAVYVTATTGEADIQGGTFSSTSSYNNAFAVCALATFGKMTIEKKAIVSAHTVRNLPVAYAVGCMGEADLTVNGGRFSATYEEDEVVKPCPPFLCAQYNKLTFNAGYIKADSVFVRDENMFPATMTLVQPKLYNLTYKGSDYNEGYRYLAVREGYDTKTAGVQTARIGTTGYSSIVDALSYANNNNDKDVVIVLQNSDVLPAGYYTLPERATLIIPKSYEQETGSEIIPRVASTSGSQLAYIQPYAYVTLTMADGVNLDVHGLIEVSGTQRATDGSYAAHPHGPCGFINMQEGSRMTMQGGSKLRAWGFIIGKGETDVRRNATICEQFQMGDWKGGSTSFGMLSDDRRVFPLTHYYIQNIESPFKYHPGAVLSTTTAVSATFGAIPLTASANDIKVIGVNGRDQAIFLMDNEADAENTWVRKWYDVEHDVQVYDINNSAHIGSMVLDLGKLGNTPLQMNSGYFVLPLTCNFKIHLLSGMMDFTQNTALLPGAEVEVDKEAIATIVKNNDPSVLSGSLYIYDADQWDKYAYDESANGGIKYTKPVQYAAGFGGKPTARANQFYNKENLKDATINVHGSFAVNEEDCYLYTSAGGANIFSTNEDAGTFVFNVQGPSEARVQQVWQVKNRNQYTNTGNMEGHSDGDGDYFVPAQLKNADGQDPAFTTTTGYGANASLCYMDNQWRYRAYFDCYAADADMDVYLGEAVKRAIGIKYPQVLEMLGGYDLSKSVSHLYIKPQEWVEIAGRAIIDFDLPTDEDERNALSDAALAYAMNQSEDNYNALFAIFYPYAMTFRLEGIEGNADHTYSDAAGTGRLFILMNSNNECQWWEVENVDNLYHCIHPLNDTYYYWWDDPDEEDPVYGEWKEKTYTITWKNWDGTVIQTIGETEDLEDGYVVTYGTMAEYLGKNPTRPATIDYTYDFTGWSPALGPVTSDVTYTATYEQKDRMYTVIFLQEGGVEIERQFLKHNDVPVCENTPTKIGHTLEWSPAIAAVTGDATYTAIWHEDPPTEYEVTFFDYDGTTPLQQSNVAVGAVPEYTGATPTGKAVWAAAQENKEFTYEFDHWSPELQEVSATSIKSYTAVYREVAQTYTVQFFEEDGTTLIGDAQSLTYGAMPVAPTATKQNPQTGYTYTYVWQNKDDATKTIETVKADADYKAVFTSTLNKYTVTVKSNPSGACLISGAGLYDYNSSATLMLTVNDGYTFTGWSDGQEGTNTSRTITVTANTELVANFDVAEPDYTITWMNEDGAGDALATVGQKAGTATTYTGAIPTKAASAEWTYTFYGWSTSANGGGDVYKNGMTPPATADTTYYAYFNKTKSLYTITWANEAGTSNIEVDYNQEYGAAIAYNSAIPTKQATAAATYTFDGWSTSVGGAKAEVPATVSGDATFYAHFAATPKTYTITWKRDDGSLIDNTEVAYGGTPSHAAPTKAATAEYTYDFTGWTPAFAEVTGVAVYTAHFNAVPRTYTITWLNEDGSMFDQTSVAYGETPSHAAPTKENCSFSGWTPEVVAVNGPATYQATFNCTPVADNIEVGQSETIEIDDARNVSAVIVASTGTLTLEGTASVTTDEFILESNTNQSGQLVGAPRLNVTGDAYFDVKFNGEAGTAHRTWYAIAVPWEVDAENGIWYKEGNRKLVLGSDFDLVWYDGAERAANGDGYACWKYVELQADKKMHPGKMYMMYFGSQFKTVRFKKTSTAPILYTGDLNAVTTVTPHPEATDNDGKDANWNGIANPAVFHATLNAGVSYGQVLGNGNLDAYFANPEAPVYTTISLGSYEFVVGKPVFVQAGSYAPVVVNSMISGAASAPRRAAAENAPVEFALHIGVEGHPTTDNLFVQIADEKENRYVIGQDLAKGGVAKTCPQLWVNRYNTKLSVNTQALADHVAEYPLGIYVPSAGAYVITMDNAREDYDLYLTLDGNAIWNLSTSEYIATLPQGTTNSYGLRAVAKSPQMATGVDEAVVDAKGEIRKVLIEDKVFIIRGNNVYSVDGQLVK